MWNIGDAPELHYRPKPWLYYFMPPPFTRAELEEANAQFGPLDQWTWDAVVRWEKISAKFAVIKSLIHRTRK